MHAEHGYCDGTHLADMGYGDSRVVGTHCGAGAEVGDGTLLFLSRMLECSFEVACRLVEAGRAVHQHFLQAYVDAAAFYSVLQLFVFS